MKPVEPIHTVELFPELSAELLRVLRNLPSAAWDKPTVCTDWSIKDVVAHLLGGSLGRLSFGRDKLVLPQTKTFPTEFAAQVDYINEQNAAWVNVARRISPAVLSDFLALTDQQLYLYFKALPPLEQSGIAVTWAGDTQSPHWFDIARETTEKWLHQQHIREAVGQPVLAQRKWLFPVLDTFMRALPHTYHDVDATDGTAIRFHITGEAGGDWSLLRQLDGWRLFSGKNADAVSIVHLDQDVAWRLLTKGVSLDKARAALQVEGDEALGLRILTMVSILA